MTFYPINSNSISPQNPRDNTFTEPYSMHDIISRPFEQLRELEISGKGTIYPVTKHLLPEETDSFTKKIIKVAIAPFTFLTMGVTIVADNLLQYFKDNQIEKLHEDLQRYNNSSKALHDSQSLGLQYFNSENYKNFEQECDSNFDNIKNQHNESKNTRLNLQKDFNSKLQRAQPNLNISLEKSRDLLEKIEKILSKSKNSNISTIRSSIKKLKSNLYFKSNIDIVNDLEDIRDSLIRIGQQIDPQVQIAISQKSQRFKSKIDSHMQEYSKIESEIGSLKREKACKESMEECLEVEAGPIKVKTSKKPKKESENNFDDYMQDLKRKKSKFEGLVVETADSYLKFLEKTSDLLEKKYRPAIIEQNHEKLKILLQNTKQNLNQYDALFPKAEKEALEKELVKVNSSTNVKSLINKCNFNYNNELSNLEELITHNSKLIKEVEDKLKELQSLSQHSPLKNEYQEKLIEKNESLKKLNSHLTDRFNKLARFKRKVFVYKEKFMNLELIRTKPLQENKYNDLYAQFDRASKDISAHKPINVQDICNKIDNFYLQESKPKLSFLY